MSIVLNTVSRSSFGKTSMKKYKKLGFIPSVVYMKDGKNLHLFVSKIQLDKLISDFTFMTKIFELNIFPEDKIELIKNPKTEISDKPVLKVKVVVKDVQFDKVTDFSIHFDFKAVEDGDIVKIAIPISFKNRDKCPTLKFGGTLLTLNYNPVIKCKIPNIPSTLDVDLTNLPVNTVVRISDLKLPKDCFIVKDRDIVKISGKKSIKEEEKVASVSGTDSAATPTEKQPAPAKK